MSLGEPPVVRRIGSLRTLAGFGCSPYSFGPRVSEIIGSGHIPERNGPIKLPDRATSVGATIRHYPGGVIRWKEGGRKRAV